MQWEIINTPKQPECVFCDKTTQQMLICHRLIGVGNVYICSSCARFVKDAMNKWKELKDPNYIENTGNIFSSSLIDEIKVGNGEPDPMGKFREPIGKDEFYSADYEPD